MKAVPCVFLSLFFLMMTGCRFPGVFEPQMGDIVFQCGRGQGDPPALHDDDLPFTMVGIVIVTDRGYKVVDASRTYRSYPLFRWMSHGRMEPIVFCRLKKNVFTWTSEQRERLMLDVAGRYGTPQDTEFDWSDETMYGAEMVWKTYREVLGISLCELRSMPGKPDAAAEPEPVSAAVTIGDLYRSDFLEIVHQE